MQVTIVGGGIIGLSCAWFLKEAGVDVTVVDRTNWQDGCSFGNAGMIVPSHFIPLASPGIIAKGIRWLFDHKSPFYIKPRLSRPLFQWLWAFYRSCTPAKVATAGPLLRDLNWLSQKLYREWATDPRLDFAYEERGLLMLYQTEKARREEVEMAEQAKSLGLEVQCLDHSALQQLEQKTTIEALGGVFYPGDAHLNPGRLMQQLLTNLRASGARLLDKTEVEDFVYDRDRIQQLVTNQGTLAVDQLIIAGGAWTPQLLKKLKLPLLLQDGKGYSITMDVVEQNITIPSILTEAKVAMTPLGQQLRIGGTLEISNMSSQINRHRVEGILEAVPRYFPEIQPTMPQTQNIWHGFRPCTPDGLPYMGPVQSFQNVTIATGHAMMGLSLGPATGQLVAATILGEQPEIDLRHFDPHRF